MLQATNKVLAAAAVPPPPSPRPRALLYLLLIRLVNKPPPPPLLLILLLSDAFSSAPPPPPPLRLLLLSALSPSRCRRLTPAWLFALAREREGAIEILHSVIIQKAELAEAVAHVGRAHLALNFRV